MENVRLYTPAAARAKQGAAPAVRRCLRARRRAVGMLDGARSGRQRAFHVGALPRSRVGLHLLRAAHVASDP
jgi:hypothetical protein